LGATSRRFDRRNRPSASTWVSAADDDEGTSVGEKLRGFLANSSGSARHEHPMILKIHLILS
jgi:hypothetical protein